MSVFVSEVQTSIAQARPKFRSTVMHTSAPIKLHVQVCSTGATGELYVGPLKVHVNYRQYWNQTIVTFQFSQPP